jgi:phosphoserine phosphatase
VKAVCFDLDGTLLRGTTVSKLLAKHLGHLDVVEELERRFAAREISNSVVADVSASHFRGVGRADVWKVLRNADWIPGIRETMLALRAHDLRLLVTTVTWTFAAEYVAAEYGLDATSGTVMAESDRGELLGRVQRYCDEFDKLAFVEGDAVRCGWQLSDYMAIGDSWSDVPLFRRAGFSVALNATPDARGAASVSLEADDLREILPVLAAAIAPRRDGSSDT